MFVENRLLLLNQQRSVPPCRRTAHAVRAAHVVDKILKDEKCGKVVRRGAYHFGRGIDHAFQYFASGLNTFKKMGICELLGVDEVRRVVRRSGGTSQFTVPAGVPQFRVYRQNRMTGAKAWGVPKTIASFNRSLLSLVGDEGPKDLPCFGWMEYQLRAIFRNDPLHRVPRDMGAPRLFLSIKPR